MVAIQQRMHLRQTQRRRSGQPILDAIAMLQQPRPLYAWVGLLTCLHTLADLMHERVVERCVLRAA
jgi:hypothetical protein